MLPVSRAPSTAPSTSWLATLVCALTAVFVLVGCGSGGGDKAASPAMSSVTIIAGPANQTVVDGQSAVLNVQASSPTPLSYQWLRNGAIIPGATDARYVTPALSAADLGAQYAVVVLDGGGIPKTLGASVTIKAVAPTVSAQPQTQSVAPGQQAVFAVVAQGSSPLSYQWQRDGVDIAGATLASYSPPATTAADNGARFRVIVRNPGGEAASEAAALQVSAAAPTVVRMLQVGVVAAGQSILISSTVAGAPPFSYQWLRNGQALSAAIATSTSPELSLVTPALGAADNGVRYALNVSTSGGSTRSSVAVITVISGATRLAAGGAHSLARSTDGRTVWAWGDNAHGQLAATGTASSATPLVVSGLPGVKALAAGSDHSLALADDGSVWAWGGNGAGALGDGTQTDRAAPRRVAGLDAVIAIAAGAGRSFALRADGSVWAWGENTGGALGVGSRNDMRVPTQAGRDVAGFVQILAVAAGARHTLALRADGQVFAFGEVAVPLADGIGSQPSPVPVAGLKSVAGVAAGDGFSLALDINGQLFSWGLNGSGQLGLGTSAASASPLAIDKALSGTPLSPTLALAAGGNHAVVQAVSGTPLVWGANASGQLGTGPARAGAMSPATLRGFASPMVAVAAGRAHTLVMLADGSVYAWGSNAAGQLGIGSSEGLRTEPVQVPGLSLR